MTEHIASLKTRWLTAIAESDLKAEVKLIAWALGARMDADGRCYPSLPRIAKDASRDRTQVSRHLPTLKDGGWLEVKRGGGRGHPNQYQALIPVHARVASLEKQVHPTTQTGAPAHAKGGVGAQGSIQEVPKEAPASEPDGSPAPWVEKGLSWSRDREAILSAS